MTLPAFEVSREGLRKILTRRGIKFVVHEECCRLGGLAVETAVRDREVYREGHR